MIDNPDHSTETLKLLASQALKAWNTDAVLSLLSDSDYIVRTMAARELQVRGDKKIFDHVIGFESSKTDHMREICAFILGQLGTPKNPFKKESIPILLKLFADANAEVRVAAAVSLGKICFDGMPLEVENALYRAVSDEDADVRCGVGSSLGYASNRQETLDALDKLFQDSNKEVREYAELGKEILNSNKEET